MSIVLDAGGCLASLRATGHVGLAAGPAGRNVVCAAATGVLRAAVAALARCPGLSARSAAPGEGRLEVEVRGVPVEERGRLLGITEMLRSGIELLAAEWPAEVELEVKS